MAEEMDVVARIVFQGVDQTKPTLASVKAGVVDLAAVTKTAAAASQEASAKELTFWQMKSGAAKEAKTSLGELALAITRNISGLDELAAAAAIDKEEFDALVAAEKQAISLRSAWLSESATFWDIQKQAAITAKEALGELALAMLDGSGNTQVLAAQAAELDARYQSINRTLAEARGLLQADAVESASFGDALSAAEIKARAAVLSLAEAMALYDDELIASRALTASLAEEELASLNASLVAARAKLDSMTLSERLAATQMGVLTTETNLAAVSTRTAGAAAGVAAGEWTYLGDGTRVAAQGLNGYNSAIILSRGNLALLGAVVGIEAVMQFGKFQRAIQQTAANSGQSAQQMDYMRSKVLQLGKEFPSNLDDIALAWRRVSDEGYRNASALQLVTAAEKGATATGSKVSDVANTLAVGMSNVHDPASQAARDMGMFLVGAQQGNVGLEQFVNGLSKAEALTGALHQPLSDIIALEATLSRAFGNASFAQTAGLNIIQHIIAPTQQAITLMGTLKQKTGVDLMGDFQKYTAGQMSLVQVLTAVRKATQGNAQEVDTLFGKIRGGTGALALLGTQWDAYLATEKKVTGGGSQLTRQWEAATQTLAYQFGIAKNNAEELLIALGQDLGPALKILGDDFGPPLKAIEAFVEHNPQLLSGIAQDAVRFGEFALVLKGLQIVGLKDALIGVADSIGLIGTRAVVAAPEVAALAAAEGKTALGGAALAGGAVAGGVAGAGAVGAYTGSGSAATYFNKLQASGETGRPGGGAGIGVLATVLSLYQDISTAGTRATAVEQAHNATIKATNDLVAEGVPHWLALKDAQEHERVAVAQNTLGDQGLVPLYQHIANGLDKRTAALIKAHDAQVALNKAIAAEPTPQQLMKIAWQINAPNAGKPSNIMSGADAQKFYGNQSTAEQNAAYKLIYDEQHQGALSAKAFREELDKDRASLAAQQKKVEGTTAAFDKLQAPMDAANKAAKALVQPYDAQAAAQKDLTNLERLAGNEFKRTGDILPSTQQKITTTNAKLVDFAAKLAALTTPTDAMSQTQAKLNLATTAAYNDFSKYGHILPVHQAAIVTDTEKINAMQKAVADVTTTLKDDAYQSKLAIAQKKEQAAADKVALHDTAANRAAYQDAKSKVTALTTAYDLATGATDKWTLQLNAAQAAATTATNTYLEDKKALGEHATATVEAKQRADAANAALKKMEDAVNGVTDALLAKGPTEHGGEANVEHPTGTGSKTREHGKNGRGSTGENGQELPESLINGTPPFNFGGNKGGGYSYRGVSYGVPTAGQIATFNKTTTAADLSQLSAYLAAAATAQQNLDTIAQDILTVSTDMGNIAVQKMTAQTTAIDNQTTIIKATSDVAAAKQSAATTLIGDQTGIMAASYKAFSDSVAAQRTIDADLRSGDTAKAALDRQVAAAQQQVDRDAIAIARAQYQRDSEAGQEQIQIANDALQLDMDKAAGDAAAATIQTQLLRDQLQLDRAKLQLAQDQITLTNDTNTILNASFVNSGGKDMSATLSADFARIAPDMQAVRDWTDKVGTDQVGANEVNAYWAKIQATDNQKTAIDSALLAATNGNWAQAIAILQQQEQIDSQSLGTAQDSLSALQDMRQTAVQALEMQGLVMQRGNMALDFQKNIIDATVGLSSFQKDLMKAQLDIQEDQLVTQEDTLKLQEVIAQGGDQNAMMQAQNQILQDTYKLQLDQYTLAQQQLAATQDANSIAALEQVIATLRALLYGRNTSGMAPVMRGGNIAAQLNATARQTTVSPRR